MFYEIDINTTELEDIPMIIKEKLTTSWIIDHTSNDECLFRSNDTDKWIHCSMEDFDKKVLYEIFSQRAESEEAYSKRRFVIECHDRYTQEYVYENYEIYVRNLEKYEEIMNNEEVINACNDGNDGNDGDDEQSEESEQSEEDDEQSEEDDEEDVEDNKNLSDSDESDDDHMQQSNQCIIM